MTVEEFIPTPQAVSDVEMEEKILAKLPSRDRERTRNLFSQSRKLGQTDIRTRIELDWNKSFV